MPLIATDAGRAYAAEAPAPRLITNVAVSSPNSAAVESVARIVAAGSSAIVAVAEVPSAVKITVSGPSMSSVKMGVTVSVVEVCPAGIRTVTNDGKLLTPVGDVIV